MHTQPLDEAMARAAAVARRDLDSMAIARSTTSDEDLR